MGSYTPGAEPQIMADGAGAPVPAGGKLHFQMHYTTMGKETVDKTQVGFYTLKAPPKYIKRSTVISTFALYIPAGEARHKEVAYLTFPADAYLYTLYPHAHYRGYARGAEGSARPDGKETMLLSLPKYDFNWQRDYDPVKPILVKAGHQAGRHLGLRQLRAQPGQPGSEAQRHLGRADPGRDDVLPGQLPLGRRDRDPRPQRPAGRSCCASQMMGSLDSNLDGFIEKSELKGPLAYLQAQVRRGRHQPRRQARLQRDGAGERTHDGAGLRQGPQGGRDAGPLKTSSERRRRPLPPAQVAVL